MPWHVQYRDPEANPRELAIEAECTLMDEGNDVFGIGTGPLADSIDRDEIARIYELWVRPRRALGEAETAVRVRGRFLSLGTNNLRSVKCIIAEQPAP
jgi:hypothetical protein